MINSSLGIGTSRKVVARLSNFFYRGKRQPQGVANSLFLWNLVVNEILFKLNNKSIKIVAYANDKKRTSVIATGYSTKIGQGK